jgi:hypothetical protein
MVSLLLSSLLLLLSLLIRCPHCIHYVSTYVDIAKENIDRYVMFYSVNCVEFRNICSSEKVTGYPSIIGYNTVGMSSTYSSSNSSYIFITIIIRIKEVYL